MIHYDILAGEWSGKCGACGTLLFAPSKSELVKSFQIHTHSDNCLGGY